MEIINRLTDIGGGIQKPDLFLVHAMGQNINIRQTEYDWYKKYRPKKDIPMGVHYAPDWLKMDGTSAHNLIETNGDILRLRSTKKIAYHALGYNENSIGAEVLLEGKYNYAEFLEAIKEDWVTEAQYESLIELTAKTIKYWNIPLDRVKRHSDVSPERKYDPGVGFRWSEFKGRVTETLQNLNNS